MISLTILFEADILSKMAVPNLAFVEEQSGFIGVVKFLFQWCPLAVVFFHCEILAFLTYKCQKGSDFVPCGALTNPKSGACPRLCDLFASGGIRTRGCGEPVQQ